MTLTFYIGKAKITIENAKDYFHAKELMNLYKQSDLVISNDEPVRPDYSNLEVKHNAETIITRTMKIGA